MTGSLPLVSVLVITYNQEAYIAQTLDSVLGQKCDFQFEIIVGEDCSTDRTRDIVKEYERKHPGIVRMITGERNVGLIGNVHRSEDAARGKYLAYLGGDDYWHNQGKIAKQVGFLESHPDYVLVHSEFARRMRDWVVDDWAKRNNTDVLPANLWSALLRNNFLCASTVCVRHDAIREYRKSVFATRGYPMEDYPRWLFASRLGKFWYLDESTTTYRVVDGALTRQSPVKMLRFWQAYRQIARDFADEYGCTETERRTMEVYHNGHLLNYAIQANDNPVFEAEFAWMKANNPDWIRPLGNRLRASFRRARFGAGIRVLERIAALRLRKYYRQSAGQPARR